tara:strand:+ start:15477 stop:18107 length:2631 start_codon:yes stop_codon:yes gene_type:complete
MYDPHAMDCPPMPPDDPASHRYMHCVDGKLGYPHWDKFGQIQSIESPQWLSYLPTSDDGEIRLDLRDAIRVARTNSRVYQQNLETLYLTALDVTFERFRFDHQLFAGAGFSQDERGRRRGSLSESAIDSSVGFTKLGATGGELLVGFANSLVWDSWGSDTDLFSSTIDFSLVQPLLRRGGRARVLENLTQTERSMLANVRQMNQFRQGFFVDIAVGRNSGPGPSRNGAVGQAGLGLIAGLPSGRNGAGDAGGYLGLLQDQQQIRNQITNIAALRDSVARLEALFDANRINSRLQVDQARQALLNAQSSLLSSNAAYQSRVDAFKVDLGLPPSLPVEIRDPFLDRFVLIDPAQTELQDSIAEILVMIGSWREEPTAERIGGALEQIDQLYAGIEPRLESAMKDLDELETRIPQRRERLRKVAEQIERLNADVDQRVYDDEILVTRFNFLQKRLPSIANDFASARAEHQEIVKEVSDLGAGELEPENNTWKRVNAYASRLSDLLLELSLVQAETRLQGIMLPPLEVDVDDAMAMARIHRLDWMNARANLVDVWRKIEFFANDLKSDLNVVIDGQLGTQADNVLDFDGDDSRIRFAVQFDTPTARLAERNRYREALINYQRARRDYMLFEDRVSQSIRNTLRLVTLSQINLEVRRVAVQVAIAQVDIARLKLNPPPQPNQASRTSPTAARDLVSALSDLLDAQNDFLNVWVANEVLRILLDFEMGTMQVDPTGMWIDPGPIDASSTSGASSTFDDGSMIDAGSMIDPLGSVESFLPEGAFRSDGSFIGREAYSELGSADDDALIEVDSLDLNQPFESEKSVRDDAAFSAELDSLLQVSWGEQVLPIQADNVADSPERLPLVISADDAAAQTRSRRQKTR